MSGNSTDHLGVQKSEKARQLLVEGKLDEAIRLYTEIFLGGNRHPGIVNNIGVAHRRRGALEMAAATLHVALRTGSAPSSTYSNLGNVYTDLQRFADAEHYHEIALQMEPENPKMHHHLGILRMEQGNLKEAIANFREAVRIEPDFHEAVWDLALALLQDGQADEGYDQYESRFELKRFRALQLGVPTWDGHLMPEGTLLVYHEQGFGDMIMAARYLAWAKSQCARLVLFCQPKLASLLQSMNIADEIITSRAHLPQADAAIPVMSLLRLAHRAGIPVSGKPYLRMPEDENSLYKSFFPGEKKNFRVGIVWSGSTSFRYNHRRAASLNAFLDLLEIPGVRLFSLQKEAPAQALEQPGMRLLVRDAGAKIDSFKDTAELLHHLDLVIMTDSALAHLCGALGKPVWVMLAHRHDWRWYGGSGSSPWYDSMKLYKQRFAGDWNEVFRRVKADLEALLKAQ